ncbi:hypothetical protein R3P38DRAFT_3539101 [Favolaschia claudopus]|uniref:Uncharacterized protein n=1 Tax=Favolaschia claudopus TaxID=2862362 RepID=A0AAW0B9K6_9AGAR
MYQFPEINSSRFKKVVRKMGTRTSPLPSYSTMNSLLLLSLLAVGAVAHRPDLTLNDIPEARTPSVSLGASLAPNLFFIVDTDPVSASHLANFENVSGTAITWPAVNASQGTLPSSPSTQQPLANPYLFVLGTQLLISIEDSTGLTRTTPPFPVTQGSGDGCLTAGSGGYSSRGAPFKPKP